MFLKTKGKTYTYRSIKDVVNVEEVRRLTKKLSKRFIKYPTKKLIVNIRDSNDRLVSKLIIDYMYGNRYSIEKLTNKGKDKITLDLIAKIDKVAKVIIEEKAKAKQNKKVNKLLNITKKFR